MRLEFLLLSRTIDIRDGEHREDQAGVACLDQIVDRASTCR